MCVVSMVTQHYHDQWQKRVLPLSPWSPFLPPVQPVITPAEVEEFRLLLEKAREYDQRNNEPDCEQDEKRQALKKLATQLGVEIEFV